MKQNSYLGRLSVWIAGCLAAVMVSGCAARHTVVSSTGTTLGVEISQNPQTQMYQAKLGYNRGEIAIVPTNRSADKEPAADGSTNVVNNGGARDSTDVIMELRFAGLFSTGENSGLYQRLAVGSNAVKQPGAAFMFAKGHGGQLDSNTVAAVSKSIESITTATPEARDFKFRISLVRRHAEQSIKDKIDQVLKEAGYDSYDAFVDGVPRQPTLDDIQRITAGLKAQGIEITQ